MPLDAIGISIIIELWNHVNSVEPLFSFLGNSSIIETVMKTANMTKQVARYAAMFSAIGTEPRLRILRLLLSAHPDGLVAGDLQSELAIPASTLSHHLDKLKNEDLVRVRREGTYLWYMANAESLQELLTFLYAECCTRSKAIQPDVIVKLCC